MTDVELDARVSALEETGGGNTENDNRELPLFSKMQNVNFQCW